MELRKDRIEPHEEEQHKQEKPFEHPPQDASSLQQDVIQHQPAKERMQEKIEETGHTPWVTTTTTTTRTSRTNVTSTATSNPFTETYTTTVTVQKDLNSDK